MMRVNANRGGVSTDQWPEGIPTRYQGYAGKEDLRVESTSRMGAYAFTGAMFLIGFLVVLVPTWSQRSLLWVVLSLCAGLLLAATVRYAYQWERAVITRAGKFSRLAAPGIFLVVPVLESVSARVDMRVRITSFFAQETLSNDLVPVNVDAVLFWLVWDAKQACTEVQSYEMAVSMAAQAAMRDAIGQISLADMAARRKYLGQQLEREIGSKVESWGISVVAMEIRDIVIPRALQDAMSRQAQAERERDARMVLAEAERDIADLYLDAATTYGTPDRAMELRTMNLVYEGMRETGGSVVVPSAYGDGFNGGKDQLSSK